MQHGDDESPQTQGRGHRTGSGATGVSTGPHAANSDSCGFSLSSKDLTEEPSPVFVKQTVLFTQGNAHVLQTTGYPDKTFLILNAANSRG